MREREWLPRTSIRITGDVMSCWAFFVCQEQIITSDLPSHKIYQEEKANCEQGDKWPWNSSYIYITFYISSFIFFLLLDLTTYTSSWPPLIHLRCSVSIKTLILVWKQVQLCYKPVSGCRHMNSGHTCKDAKISLKIWLKMQWRCSERVPPPYTN